MALFPGCEILDFAGPLQALFEAGATGGVEYGIVYCAVTPEVRTAQGLVVSSLEPLPTVEPTDWVFIPGYTLHEVRPPVALVKWVRAAHQHGARICSVCTGAFILGDAGLLDGRRCTTHWRRIPELQRRFKNARVVGDQLFAEDGRIVTSAGIAAGIDMTLALLEQDAGPAVASAVAREMVVYVRRDATQRQESVYLDYQMHLNPAVHELQRYLIRHPESRDSIQQLGRRVGMSPRNLTRVFRRATGISIHEYRMRLRLELARTQLRNPSMTLEAISAACGFGSARQLRRLFVSEYGLSPTGFRAAAEHA
jgi:transcriptional regulator GlxA family with amidase domain